MKCKKWKFLEWHFSAHNSWFLLQDHRTTVREFGSSSQVKMCTRYQWVLFPPPDLTFYLISVQSTWVSYTVTQQRQLTSIGARCSLCCDKHRMIYKPASKWWANLFIFFQNTWDSETTLAGPEAFLHLCNYQVTWTTAKSSFKPSATTSQS